MKWNSKKRKLVGTKRGDKKERFKDKRENPKKEKNHQKEQQNK